jgi:hypothetical protein
MSTVKQTTDFLVFVPQVIEADWDRGCAPRLAGFPVNIIYTARIEGGIEIAAYVFDPATLVQERECRRMQYRPTVDNGFSVTVVVHPDGKIETFKYRGSDLICEACGPDFQTAMIQTSMCGLVRDELSTTNTEMN